MPACGDPAGGAGVRRRGPARCLAVGSGTSAGLGAGKPTRGLSERSGVGSLTARARFKEWTSQEGEAEGIFRT